ncbi:MAG: hypothetical protein ACTS2F_14365 [Thainema sp.]
MTHPPDLQAIRAKLRSLQEDDVLPPVIEPDWQTPQQRLAERAATDATELSFELPSDSDFAEQASSHQQANAIAALQKRSQHSQPSTNGVATGFGMTMGSNNGHGATNGHEKGQTHRQQPAQIRSRPANQSRPVSAESVNSTDTAEQATDHPATDEQTIAEAIAHYTATEESEAATDPSKVGGQTAHATSARPSFTQSSTTQSSTERVYSSTKAVATPPNPGQAAAQRWQQSRQKIQLQIEQINQLAQLQETAIRDLRVMSEVAAHWQRVVAEDQGVPSQQVILPFCWSNQPLGVPAIQQNERGQWLVQTRFIDLLQAEREAEEMATQLRHRHLRSRPYRGTQPAWLGWLRWLQQQWQQWWQPLSKQLGLAASPRRAARASSRKSSFYPAAPNSSVRSARESTGQPYQQWSQPAGNFQPRAPIAGSPAPSPRSSFPMPDFSLLDISIWITGAAIARVGLDWMLANLPFTAPVVIGLILAVTGWAVYRATTDSELTLTLGYRALLLMIGLLLGGTL